MKQPQRRLGSLESGWVGAGVPADQAVAPAAPLRLSMRAIPLLRSTAL